MDLPLATAADEDCRHFLHLLRLSGDGLEINCGLWDIFLFSALLLGGAGVPKRPISLSCYPPITITITQPLNLIIPQAPKKSSFQQNDEQLVSNSISTATLESICRFLTHLKFRQQTLSIRSGQTLPFLAQNNSCFFLFHAVVF
ncbi:conserved hypothetical protein [Ricinus communis]|uniref:Uncharacterized protein n=1 Tax=Ricinus communis TaxID=3988 RepID=B9T3C4_RICCO|nr:conserved hypothetical protein [Ricinus communis]